MNEHLIISLLLLLASAWAVGAVFARIGLPSVLAGLLVGFILGPPGLNLVTPSPSLDFLAELGIFFVMYYVGMEMDPKKLLAHLLPSVAVACGGFFLTFGLGFLTATVFGSNTLQALFMGLVLAVTAIAVQAAILKSLQVHRSVVGHVIIGAALVDDILALICLSVLIGLVQGGTIQVAVVGVILFKVIVFFGVTILVGHFVIPLATRRLDDIEGKGFTFAMISALIMAYLAELAGLHLIIGAFLAGQFVRKEIMDETVYERIRERFSGLSFGFLLPIFFATLAFHVRLSQDLHFLIFTGVVVLTAMSGKFVGGAIGARLAGFERRQAMVIGLGMNGWGAVELVIIGVVIKLSGELVGQGKISEPLLTESQVSALVLMVFITTLVSPILLRWALRRTPV